jgi:hypothetical protein
MRGTKVETMYVIFCVFRNGNEFDFGLVVNGTVVWCLLQTARYAVYWHKTR